jgi:DNA-binding NarL/FixJ family response regulator
LDFLITENKLEVKAPSEDSRMYFLKQISNLRTLIVEDNAFFRDILREKLRAVSPSMLICEASEGREALEKVEALTPELIFMDIRLPGQSGIQLTQEIKARYPNTRVVFLTSYDCFEYRQAALRAGGICYIPKDSLNYVQLESLIKSLVKPTCFQL